MTRSEQIVAAIVVTLVVLAIVLPAAAVEIALTVQVLVLAIIAGAAGLYIFSVFRGLNRASSEYLWTLIRRDLRVTLGLAMLGFLAIAVLGSRIFNLEWTVPRPWAVLWLVVAIDLFAVGLIDDALVIRRDRDIQ